MSDTSDADVRNIVESARRLGIELDEVGTIQWLTAMAASQDDDQIVVDTASGTFGHKVSMLDFSPRDLERFRRIGQIVLFFDNPGTALPVGDCSQLDEAVPATEALPELVGVAPEVLLLPGSPLDCETLVSTPLLPPASPSPPGSPQPRPTQSAIRGMYVQRTMPPP